jgi:predicted transcriptional regulator of viral defense system
VKESSQTIRHSLVIDPGMDKLQELLLAMAPGDELSVARATEVSGLDPSQCDVVLEGLMRAGFMVRINHGAYVRCQLDVTRPVSRTAPAAAVVSRNVLGS